MKLTSLLRTAVTLAVFSVLSLASVQKAQAQTETVLYSFCSVSLCYDGAAPSGALTADRYGNFYGTTQVGGTGGCVFWVCEGGTVFQLSVEPAGSCPSGFKIGNGWCETVLYNFCSAGAAWPYCPDGEAPYADLTLVPPPGHYSTSVGTFYGTTYNGGTGAGCTDSNGCGIAFELSPEPLPSGFGCPGGTNLGNGWCETVIYNFCSLNNCDDGTYPGSGLVRDAAGNLYGTAQSGVFELSPNSSGGWTEAMIYSIVTNSGGLAIDAAGNLYGADAIQNVFKLSRDSSGVWVATNIHTFTGAPDGLNPTGAPAVDSLGNVYGTTANGGSGLNCVSGCGTVWKLTPVKTGTLAGTYTKRILHSFSAEKTGYYPGSGVTLNSSGNIYGTTTTAGKYLTPCQNTNNVNIGCGTIFELAKTATGYTFKLLWSFNNTDGGFPFANPVLDSAGNLYGTAFQGGASYSGGVVFKLNPSGTATATTTTLISSLNPSTYGEEVTFTAVVTPAPLNGETVTFERGTTALGTGVLNGGSASFTIATLPVGTSDVKAVYGGDGDSKASTSNTLPQVVKD